MLLSRVAVSETSWLGQAPQITAVGTAGARLLHIGSSMSAGLGSALSCTGMLDAQFAALQILRYEVAVCAAVSPIGASQTMRCLSVCNGCAKQPCNHALAITSNASYVNTHLGRDMFRLSTRALSNSPCFSRERMRALCQTPPDSNVRAHTRVSTLSMHLGSCEHACFRASYVCKVAAARE